MQPPGTHTRGIWPGSCGTDGGTCRSPWRRRPVSRCACNNSLRGTIGLHRNGARLLRGAYLLKIRLGLLNLVVMHIGGAL